MLGQNVFDVAVHLETEHVQDNQVEHVKEDYSGVFFKMGDAYYLRYKENKSDDPATVTFKLEEGGKVTLTRAQSTVKLRLFFADQERIEASYQTPYGILPIQTTTPYLSLDLTQAPGVGRISLDYDLHSRGEKLGSYKIRLQFQA